MTEPSFSPQHGGSPAPREDTFPWAFFLLTFCISWPAWAAAIAIQHFSFATPLGLLLQLLGSFGPTLAALILSARNQRESATRLLKRGLPSGLRVPFLMLIVVIPLGVNGVAYWLAGGRHPNLSLLMILETFVLYFFLGGSVGEEFGWRGYALDRLQLRWSWLPSALLLGIIWSAWHYPLRFLTGSHSAMDLLRKHHLSRGDHVVDL